MLAVFMHTIGVVAILWSILNIVNLITYLDDPRHKYLGERIVIHGKFFIPFIGLIFYIVWWVVG